MKEGQKIRARVDPPPPLFGQCPKENIYFQLRPSLTKQHLIVSNKSNKKSYCQHLPKKLRRFEVAAIVCVISTLSQNCSSGPNVGSHSCKMSSNEVFRALQRGQLSPDGAKSGILKVKQEYPLTLKENISVLLKVQQYSTVDIAFQTDNLIFGRL